jgi:hypothetical protein
MDERRGESRICLRSAFEKGIEAEPTKSFYHFKRALAILKLAQGLRKHGWRVVLLCC